MQVVFFIAAITYILFCFVTLKVDVAFVDGPPRSYYGFPLLYKSDTYFSVSYGINYVYLTIDFIFYYLIVLAVIAVVSVEKVYHFISKYKWGVIITIIILSVVPILESIFYEYQCCNVDLDKDINGGESGHIISKEIYVGTNEIKIKQIDLP